MRTGAELLIDQGYTLKDRQGNTFYVSSLFAGIVYLNL